MTKGPLIPQLFRFSLPLMATSLLQLLYNAADMVVVGRFAGSQSLAAVSSTGALINLITNLFIGFSLGANVVIAHANGAGDHKAVSRNVHTAITLSLISGVIVMIIGLVLSRPLLQLMGSPDDVIDLATLYMQIFFLGMPVNLLYNFGAGIMRAIGDTRRPLIYLSISGMVNVILNLILVIVLHMGVAGVAIATVVSQTLSALFVILYLLRTEANIRLNPRKLRLDMKCVGPIVRVGLPAGIQSALFSLSNVIIQSSINAQGSIWMAGNGAAANIEGFAYVSMNSIAQGTLTFASTNRGARNYPRVRRVLWSSLGVVMVTGLAVGLLAWACGPMLLGLYDQNPDVITKGMVRMGIILPTYFICGLMDVAASHMRGVGYSIAPMIVSLSGACAFRLLWVYTVFAADPSNMPLLYVSYPISWLLTFLAHMMCYIFMARKKMQQEEGLKPAVSL
ncbi:MAG: MATE family efflux transporter [Clostridiales bacterium]|nr:MATE family efflux transporter [Clostridiales bacterium]